MDNPNIIKALRNHPFVVEKINAGYDLADIFFEFHMKSVSFTDEELQKYNITREDADIIVKAILGFATELYNQKQNKTLLNVKDNFPKEAMIYNRNKKD